MTWQRKRRLDFCKQYKLQPTRKRLLMLTIAFMAQLDRCKDDAARRLLLGVSR